MALDEAIVHLQNLFTNSGGHVVRWNDGDSSKAHGTAKFIKKLISSFMQVCKSVQFFGFINQYNKYYLFIGHDGCDSFIYRFSKVFERERQRSC